MLNAKEKITAFLRPILSGTKYIEAPNAYPMKYTEAIDAIWNGVLQNRSIYTYQLSK